MTPKSSISLLSFPLSTHRDYDFWVYLADPTGQTELGFQSQFRVGYLEKLSRLSRRSKRCCALLVPLSHAFLLHVPIICVLPTIPCSQLCARNIRLPPSASFSSAPESLCAPAPSQLARGRPSLCVRLQRKLNLIFKTLKQHVPSHHPPP